MTAKLRGAAARAKSAHCTTGNQIGTTGNQISPVMQKVRDVLPTSKAALHLQILTEQSLSICQKVLSGDRHENLAMVTALLRSDHGREVLFALMGDANPPWFAKYRKQLDVNAARRQLLETQRAIERLQAEAAE